MIYSYRETLRDMTLLEATGHVVILRTFLLLVFIILFFVFIVVFFIFIIFFLLTLIKVLDILEVSLKIHP
jgi:hypothetical protein